MSCDFITPDRESPLQSEFTQVIGDLQIHMVFGVFLAAEVDYGFVRQFDLLGEMAEHHCTSERSWKIGNQHPVVAARASSGNGAGGVTSEPVRHEPLLDQQ